MIFRKILKLWLMIVRVRRNCPLIGIHMPHVSFKTSKQVKDGIRDVVDIPLKLSIPPI